jgi:uncharacterized protein YggU (UPF0235/DUF167 family)
LLIKVHVYPCLKEEGVSQIGVDAFRVNVAVKPENGQANARAVELLAQYFAVPAGKIRLIKGGHEAHKIFDILE